MTLTLTIQSSSRPLTGRCPLPSSFTKNDASTVVWHSVRERDGLAAPTPRADAVTPSLPLERHPHYLPLRSRQLGRASLTPPSAAPGRCWLW